MCRFVLPPHPPVCSSFISIHPPLPSALWVHRPERSTQSVGASQVRYLCSKQARPASPCQSPCQSPCLCSLHLSFPVGAGRQESCPFADPALSELGLLPSFDLPLAPGVSFSFDWNYEEDRWNTFLSPWDMRPWDATALERGGGYVGQQGALNPTSAVILPRPSSTIL